MNDRHIFYKGMLLVFFAAVLFGTTGTSQALAPEGISPSLIGVLRLIIGGPSLLLLLVVTGRFNPLKFRGPILPILIAACGIIMFQFCFFEAVSRTGVALGTIIAICMGPVIAGLLGAVFQKEKLTIAWVISSILAISGCIILTGPGDDITVDRAGVILAAGAGFGYAVSLVASKAAFGDRSPVICIAIILCTGALLVLPRLLFEDMTQLMTPRGLAVVLYLGTVATAGAYLLLAKGLALIPVSSTAVIMLAEPLTGCLLGVLLLGEIFTMTSAGGAMLIFCGLIIVATDKTDTT
ncbi:MAG: EamA family transporter [Desulfamplus sp.]|nr:EamA family transporter [Desulfamplus sp.]